MKKNLFIIFIFLFIIIFLIISKNNQCRNKRARIYKIDNKNYCLLIGSSRAEWERGLMFYEKPVDFDGMIFIFPDKQYRTFWNKNTYLNLDLYWIDNNKVVGKSFLPSINKNKETITVSSPKIVNKVVEIIKE